MTKIVEERKLILRLTEAEYNLIWDVLDFVDGLEQQESFIEYSNLMHKEQTGKEWVPEDDWTMEKLDAVLEPLIRKVADDTLLENPARETN